MLVVVVVGGANSSCWLTIKHTRSPASFSGRPKCRCKAEHANTPTGRLLCVTAGVDRSADVSISSRPV